VYSDYFARVKDLVQHASEKNGNKPVIFIGHSFGGRVVLDFINSTPLPWRKKFIKHMVLISPTPPTGFMQVLTNLASGPTVVDIPTVPQLDLRPMWWTFPSSVLSIPSPVVFGHEPLVITKHKNYSAYDYVDFLAALGLGNNGIFPSTKWILPTNVSVVAPMVPTTYISGIGVQTPEQAVFLEGNFDVDPYYVYGDGDGCINLVSVLAFAKELHRQHQPDNIPFKFVKIPNATHSFIIVEENSLRTVISEILEANS
jgi:lysophospholipase-3